MLSTVAVTHILLSSAIGPHCLTVRLHYQLNCCTIANYNQHFHYVWGTQPQEVLNIHANNSKANHNCTTGPERAPFYAGQDVSVWDTHRHHWLSAKIRCYTADHTYLIKTPAGSQYTCTQDYLKACYTAAQQTLEGAKELEPPTPTTVPHTATTTPTVAPATPATLDKSSVLPATPRPDKFTPVAPAPLPVLWHSKQTIVPSKCLITEK